MVIGGSNKPALPKPEPVLGNAMPNLAYRSDRVEIYHRPGAGEDLLITFSYLNMAEHRPDLQYFGQQIAEALDIPVLGIVGKGVNWFPEVDFRPPIDVIRPILDRYSRRLVLGSSMGAYGALRYSRDLRATAVVACVPQYAIDPETTAGYDDRYAGFYDASVHGDMRIKATDVAGTVFIIYDPRHAADSGHVAALTEVIPAARLITCQNMGHDAYGALSGMQQLAKVIDAAHDADKERLQRLVAIQRRTTARRKIGLASSAAKRHPRWAIRILDQLSQSSGGSAHHDAIARQLFEIAEGEIARRDLVLALFAISESLNLVDQVASRWSRKSWILQELGDAEGAVLAAEQGYQLDPTTAYSVERLGRALFFAQRWDEALTFGLQAVARFPCHAMALELLSLIVERRGDRAAALAFLSQAIEANPSATSWWGRRRDRLAQEAD